VNPLEAVKLAFTRCLDYRGRSSRSEYWWVVLFASIMGILLVIVIESTFPGTRSTVTGAYKSSDAAQGFELLLYGASLFWGLPLAIRRLHDSGKSWPFLLFGLIPFGGIVLLVFLCMDTEMTVNRWGPPPK
jgi:uncharacterized membrane protein YhaH (DUF805 family)